MNLDARSLLGGASGPLYRLLRLTKAIRRGEGYIRREVGRLEGRARRSSFPSLDRLALPLDRPPLLRLPNPPPTADLAAADLSPGLLRRRHLLPGQHLCYCPVLVLANALPQVQLYLRRCGYIDPVRPLYSSSYPPLLTRPLSVVFTPCTCFYLGSYSCTSRLLRAHHLSSRFYQCDFNVLLTRYVALLLARLAGY